VVLTFSFQNIEMILGPNQLILDTQLTLVEMIRVLL